MAPIMPKKSGKETIHSGHFMVSHVDKDFQDEEDLLGVPLPDEDNDRSSSCPSSDLLISQPSTRDGRFGRKIKQVAIDSSLTKLFQCMTLAYR